MRFAGVGAALVVAGAACLLAWFMRLPQAPTAVQTAAAAMDAVPKAAPPTREAWPPVGGVDALPASTKPRIFSAGAMADLPCLRRWDAADLAARGAAIELQCWRQSAPEFVLARGREAEFSRSRSVSLVNTTLGAFWEEQRLLQSSVGGATAAAAAAAGTPLELAYHSGPLAAWGDDLEADGEAALRALAISDAPEGQKPDQWPASSANVWMGSRGVLATPHYDTSHNIVLQVLGVKRWLLWPPAQLGALRMHPATHPSRRQARIQPTTP